MDYDVTDVSHAIVVGKFYPPHAGHHKLIQAALADCDKVTVAVCFSSVENISVWDRVAWMKEEYKDEIGPLGRIQFIVVSDDTPVLYTDETWNGWMDELMKALDGHTTLGYPNVVYSGEDYAPEFARRLLERYEQRWNYANYPREVDFVQVDRSELPVSASLFRSNPPAAWDLLNPAAKAGLCKRIVILGPESSGTTTLATALAKHYDTVNVPEYGRYFDAAVGKTHTWTADDFHHIKRMQEQMEDEMARVSRNGLLICDTDAWATALFSDVYLGEEIEGLRPINREADLYIITGHKSVPFEDDGTRFNSGRRNWFHDMLTSALFDKNTILVDGDHKGRLEVCIYTIDSLLRNWGIEEPLEYRG